MKTIRVTHFCAIAHYEERRNDVRCRLIHVQGINEIQLAGCSQLTANLTMTGAPPILKYEILITRTNQS